MKIKILVFGILADRIGQTTIETASRKNVGELREFLVSEYPQLENLRYSISVNRQISDDDKQIKGGDEVALLPPFAGG